MATESEIHRHECCTPLAREPFVSYSLNFEDVILNRLFVGVATGFYIDVGAAHPRMANDTFLFYQKGWRGINIEPNQRFYAALVTERPQDINLPVVLSDVPGAKLAYYEVDADGLSTCDAEQANSYRAAGRNVVERLVPVMTLSNIIKDAGIDRINILKVDVEGFEEKVLDGNDWERFRPEVVVVEATYPNSPVRRPTKVLDAMEQRGYRRVYFDGLNDFFLERDFPAPEGLTLPPNVFDHFVSREVVELRREHREAAEYAQSLENELKPLRTEVLEALHAVVELRREHREAAEYAQSLENELKPLRTEVLEALHAADSLAVENRRLGDKIALLDFENRRLRGAAEQMRIELLDLQKLLEPSHARLESRLESIYNSRSWRITAPLRWCDNIIRQTAQKYLGRR
jgi:FkbM family methyltransferase